MASLGLTHEELKAVEQTRQRLSQLASSLNSLQNNAFTSNPLPNLDSLQASANILNNNVQAILDVIAQNNDLFTRVVVHPSTNFPGRTQEGILLQLLRKKPEPDVEAAMDEGREMLASLPVPNSSSDSLTQGVSAEQAKERALEEIWATTREACQARIAHYVMNEEGDAFTAEERAMGLENVRTGLRRALDEDEDDEDEEDEEGTDRMVVDRPPPPPAPAPVDVASQEAEGKMLETVLRVSVLGRLGR
ncbi:hypothetical protein GGS21DRAFT_502469 [Xylaria nigripes]|nr:hypothetical protein GGS21DRAFT_502469 [Xylaria nigripes]